MEKEIINSTPAPGEEEIWVTCKDYPAYEVSTFGNVRNATTKALMKPKFTNSGGYAQVHFRIGVEDREHGKYETIHRLVAEAFCENPDPEHKYMVDHINRDRKNNYYKNLRWVTPKENAHNTKPTRNPSIYKKKTPMVLLNAETNELIKEFPNTFAAAKELGLSARVIVESIHNDRPCLKVGRFMSKTAYEKFLEENQK